MEDLSSISKAHDYSTGILQAVAALYVYHTYNIGRATYLPSVKAKVSSVNLMLARFSSQVPLSNQ